MDCDGADYIFPGRVTWKATQKKVKMKFNELRIGDIVFYGKKDGVVKTVQICGLSEDRAKIQVYADCFFQIAKYKHLQPIFLTQELFMKCQFDEADQFIMRRDVMSKSKEKQRLDLTSSTSMKVIRVGVTIFFIANDGNGNFELIHRNDKEGYEQTIKTVQYLHELQNIYYMLKGAELPINIF